MSKKFEILRVLKEHRWISGQKLAELLGISRSDVHKHITSLRESGYKITAKRNLGYILKSVPEVKTYRQLEFVMKEFINTISIRHYPMLDSTQTQAKKLADRDLKEWAVVVADVQTSGYGRLKRSWSSGVGGLWFSILLRPEIEPALASSISLVTSLAVVEMLKKTAQINCFLKWPNDVVYIKDTKLYKVAGILTEMSTDVESVRWVVVGCGINVNNKIPQELKEIAISLKSICGKSFSTIELLKGFLMEFKGLYKRFIKEGFCVFKELYNKRCIITGKQVIISNLYGERLLGVACGVNDKGHLILDSNNKKLEVISGDVTIKEIR